MTASRKILRADLKAYMAPTFVSANLLQAETDFYEYEPSDYGGRSPVIFLNANGAEHGGGTKALDSTFSINVHLLALYADLQPSEGDPVYYEKDAADLLDDLEQKLSELVSAKRRYEGKWQDLAFEGRSVADDPQKVGGDLYLHETHILVARLY